MILLAKLFKAQLASHALRHESFKPPHILKDAVRSLDLELEEPSKDPVVAFFATTARAAKYIMLNNILVCKYTK